MNKLIFILVSAFLTSTSYASHSTQLGQDSINLLTAVSNCPDEFKEMMAGSTGISSVLNSGNRNSDTYTIITFTGGIAPIFSTSLYAQLTINKTRVTESTDEPIASDAGPEYKIVCDLSYYK